MFQVSDGSEYVQGPISLDRPAGELPVVDDARWSADLTSDSLAAVVVWIVMLVVLQAALWPLVRRTFGRFPDRGWGFARLVTLLVSAYPVWLLASLELISFRAIWCGAAVLVMALAAWSSGLLRRDRVRAARTHEPWYRNRFAFAAELVFWLFFGVFLLYRLINPDSWHIAWGGEKPMEFAHINAMLRTAHFPPADPWYADGVLNYYYYGMYLVAFLMKVTGIPSEIAFNLAQPTMIAFLAAGAFSVGCGLASSISRRTRWVIGGGLLAVLLVNVAGNLVAASRLVDEVRGQDQVVNDYGYWVWDPRQIVPRTINEFPYFTALYADLHAHVVALPITVLVIGLCLAVVQEARGLIVAVTRPAAAWAETIGLTARVGLTALALGTLSMTNAWDVPTYGALVLVSLLTATRLLASWWRRIGLALALAVVTGVLAYASALPFSLHYVARYGQIDGVRETSPLYAIEAHFGVFLLVVAFGLSALLAREWREPPAICQPGVFALALLGLLLLRWSVADGAQGTVDLVDGLTAGLVTGWLLFALLLAAPKRLEFNLPIAVMRLLAAAAWLVVIGALATDRIAFALLFGLGAVAGLMWLMGGTAGHRMTLALVAGAMFVAAGVEIVFLVDDLSGGDFYRMNTVFKFYNAAWVMAALGSAALIVQMARGLGAGEAPVTAPARSIVADFNDRTQPTPERPLDLVGTNVEARPADVVPPAVFASGAGTSRGDDEVESGYVPLVEEPDEPVATASARSGVSVRDGWARGWAQVGMAVSALAIVASLAYPVMATGIRLDQHFPQEGRSWTLNGLDWMNYGQIPTGGGVTLSYDEDRAVIEWFNSEVPGSLVIAEANLGAYMCSGSRISVHTGLPVVVGWSWHETQQRGWSDLAQRVEDLRLLYTSGDPAVKRSIIEKYRIEYIVVGNLERAYPFPDCTVTDNEAGIAAFRPMVGTDLEVAFQAGETIVYRVVS